MNTTTQIPSPSVSSSTSSLLKKRKIPIGKKNTLKKSGSHFFTLSIQTKTGKAKTFIQETVKKIKKFFQQKTAKIKSPINISAKDLTVKDIGKVFKKSQKGANITTIVMSTLGAFFGSIVGLAGGTTILVNLFNKSGLAESLTILSVIKAPFVGIYSGVKFLGLGAASAGKGLFSLVSSL